MSKTSILTGLIVSVLGHTILFWDYIPGLEKKNLVINTTKEQAAKAINVANIQMQKPLEVKPHEAKQPPMSVLNKVEKLVSPKKVSSKGNRGDFSDKDDENSIPSLRLIWDNPDEIIAAQRIGLKILAVEKGNQIVGELIFDGTLSVKPYQGDMSNYSNRVRTISYDFFGRQILSEINRPIDCWFILIPAEIDRKWLTIQQQAIHEKGLKYSEVAYVEARLVSENNGYELVITKIVKI